jgi:glyoxylase-like metal-dependent hydrolase (beta-lactamase superfamily II)
MTDTLCTYPRFEIGAYTITVIPVGKLALDGGAMFGVVPKVLWEKLIPADHCNRIPLSLNCLLVEYGNEKCLLDTGVGTKFSPKYQDMYGITEAPPIGPFLEPLGLTTADITKLMFTHLHFDHAGGCTCFNDDGDAIPTFENAEFIIHQGEWRDAVNPGPKSKASYLPENFIPLQESGRLTLIDGPETEILPGLKLRVTGGHTEYHQALVLDTPDGGFIYWGDLIPTHHHLKLPYVMSYDLYPVETMARKERYLKEAFEKQWLNFFEHDLDVAACRLDYNEGKQFYFAKDDPSVTRSA